MPTKKPSEIMKEVDMIVNKLTSSPSSGNQQDLSVSRAELSKIINELHSQKLNAKIVLNIGADGSNMFEITVKGDAAKRLFIKNPIDEGEKK